MLTLRRGTVSAVLESAEELVRIEVDGAPCVAYPRLTGPVAMGDDVLVNVQARELGLGSGGFDVLHANLTRGLDLPADEGAHVMKLPYTPLQAAARHVEEDGRLADGLAGLPVVCCTLHSQLAPVCAGLGGLRVAYLQIEGGALPVSLSDTVRALRGSGLLETTIAVGACIDGDAQCVTVEAGLAWSAAAGFEAAVCALGPGIVGTGTALGHGGLSAARAARAAVSLGGAPILAVRVSAADERGRHRGVSHHARSVLALAGDGVVAAWPVGLEAPPWLGPRQEVAVDGWEAACDGLELSHMGRGPREDADFFAAAFAAGVVARRLALDRKP